jgi:hypothetical protein
MYWNSPEKQLPVTSAPAGYRSVTMINPQAADLQRGQVGTKQNGDIIVQVVLMQCDTREECSQPFPAGICF